MTLAPLAVTIREQRLAGGFTLEELAARARVSRSTLAKIEAGATPDPGFSVVSRLLQAAEATNDVVLELHRATASVAQPRVFGLGYQGHDQASLIAELKRNHVTTVADVRLTPLSRKRGLSKTALSEGLNDAGIGYLHLPALGNPKDNRPGYGDPTNAAARRRFTDRLAEPKSAQQLQQLRELAESEVVAVLCFERDEQSCHREQVLASI